MRLLKPFSLVLVLLAFLAPTALAAGKPAKGARLDPSFGNGGKTVVRTPKYDAEEFATDRIATAASGASYVLQGSGRNVYAFGPNGKPSANFGTNGRVRLPEPAEAIAVDSKGRVVLGRTLSTGPDAAPGVMLAATGSEAEIMRYLPNGKPDPTFGTEGVIKTNFGMPAPAVLGQRFAEPIVPGSTTYERPIVRLTALAVDAQNRPVVGASYAEHAAGCGENRVGFVARLAENGALDTSFGSGGHAIVQTGGQGGAAPQIALTPEPGFAVLVPQGVINCVENKQGTNSSVSGLNEAGAPSPGFAAIGSISLGESPRLAVDGQGRILLLAAGPGVFEPEQGQSILRLLPNGALDPSFGDDGTASVKELGFEEYEGLATDSRGRVIVGGRPGSGPKRFQIARLSASGHLESSFGTKGVLSVSFGKGAYGVLGGLAVDSKGRILAAGPLAGEAVKGGQGLGIARILPGS